MVTFVVVLCLLGAAAAAALGWAFVQPRTGRRFVLRASDPTGLHPPVAMRLKAGIGIAGLTVLVGAVVAVVLATLSVVVFLLLEGALN